MNTSFETEATKLAVDAYDIGTDPHGACDEIPITNTTLSSAIAGTE